MEYQNTYCHHQIYMEMEDDHSFYVWIESKYVDSNLPIYNNIGVVEQQLLL